MGGQTLHISMFCYCAMVDPIVTKIEINAKRKPIKFCYKSPLNRVDLIVTKIERNVLIVLSVLCSSNTTSKEIGDEESYYSTKILIFSFIWAGLAALHKASTI